MPQITASFDTLLKQASDTAHTYFHRANETISGKYNPEYAKAHPELVAALVQAAGSDFNNSTNAKIIEEGLESIATAIHAVANRINENPVSPAEPALNRDALVGRYFHSVENGRLGWQGTIIASPQPGLYLVQLFEWMLGTPNVQRLMRAEDMCDWLFYESHEAMQESRESGVARRGGPFDKGGEYGMGDD